MNLISQLSLAYGFEAYMLLILISFSLLLCYQITIQRTELNSPLGLEVQLHITEAVCPALSEPGMLKRLCIIWMFLCLVFYNLLITISILQDYEPFFAS